MTELLLWLRRPSRVAHAQLEEYLRQVEGKAGFPGAHATPARHLEARWALMRARALAAFCAAEVDEYELGMKLLEAQSAAGLGNFSEPVGRNAEVREGRRQTDLLLDPGYAGLCEGARYYRSRQRYCEALAEGLAHELRFYEAQRNGQE
jgi:hypothetical protein